MRRRGPNDGFTLIEVTVALAVFAVLSVMAYGGLRAVLDAQAATEDSIQRLGELQVAFGRVESDLGGAVDRQVRDGLGDTLPPLTGGSGGVAVELTVGGRPNPADRDRSSLQRVAYRLEGGELRRLVWPVLDRAQDSVPSEGRLLSGVSELRLTFLDRQGQWREDWPPEEQSPGEGLPVAVEVIVDLEDWGEVPRVFRLPGPGLEQP